ncbi:MAG: hypothetical protein JXR58_01010 [Bacteroidales bacterium]|nr:hypothetical protein [Bacteroidales bacterium]
MNEFIKKNRRGLLGTLGFHSLLIVVLVICSFTTPLPLPEEQGILIDFGDSETGMGDQESSEANAGTSQSGSNESSENENNESNIVQDYEKSHQINNNSNNSSNTTQNNNNKNTNQESDNNTTSPGLSWGNNNNSNGSDGNNGKEGDQGDKNGGDTDNYTGVTNVNDSELRHRPKPPCGVNVTGYVVVEVLINSEGKVTKAYQNKVSNVIDQTQIDCVIKSAYEAKYKPISGKYTRRHLITFEFTHR